MSYLYTCIEKLQAMLFAIFVSCFVLFYPSLVLGGDNGECPASLNSSPSEQVCLVIDEDKQLTFSHTSLDQGIDYYRNHPAPLLLLIPRKKISVNQQGKNYLGPEYGSGSGHDTLQRNLKAQSKLLNWFREDLNKGQVVPEISEQRLAKINQLLTGDDCSTLSKEPDETYGINVSMDINDMTPQAIKENMELLSNLRKQARMSSNGLWGYTIKLYGKEQVNNDKFFKIDHKKLIETLKERANFFETFLKTSSKYKYEDHTDGHGRFITRESNMLALTEGMRLANTVEKIAPGTLHRDERVILSFNSNADEERELFFALDIPDIVGNTQASELCGKRYWLSLFSQHENIDGLPQTFFIYLMPGTSISGNKTLFKMAIKNLVRRLKPSMTSDELVKNLAVSWQEMILAHAFRDGNGRLVRLLMNSILMAYGQPPLTCDPDCHPLNRLKAEVVNDIHQAMQRTIYLKGGDYPLWISHPQQREWKNVMDKAARLEL